MDRFEGIGLQLEIGLYLLELVLDTVELDAVFGQVFPPLRQLLIGEDLLVRGVFDFCSVFLHDDRAFLMGNVGHELFHCLWFYW